jgi:hypothetical protein
MIKMNTTKTDFLSFMVITTPAVDGYVQWSKSSLAYDYYNGPHQAMLEKLHSLVGQYFNNWARQIPGYSYHCNDGRAEGGGVTGPVCYFGDMPCYFSIRFWKGQILAEVYRAQHDFPGASSWRPGDRLYRVRVWTGPDVFANEECFFGNILNR